MIDLSLFDNLNRVGIAVSGGRDSMALLYDVARNFPTDFFYVINIEHGIRGDESKEDSSFVEKYAASLGVECIRYDVDAVGYSKEHGYTLEQGARLLRRQIFAREVKEGRASRVALAHHLDDNVESILMHIFRGSGLRGVKGMMADNGTLIRPLLAKSRAEIDAFIKENNIPYREDSTNSDDAYRRNFIRNSIMPLLRSRYNGIDNNIMRLARSASEDEAYLSAIADEHITYVNGRALIDIDTPNVIMKRCIFKAFSFLHVNHDVENRHYDMLVELGNMRNGTSFDMPYGVVATKEYDKIALYIPNQKEDLDSEFMLGNMEYGDFMISTRLVSEVSFNKRYDGYRVLYADFDKLKGASLRCRCEGDFFAKFGGGTKKLKDYLIDIKVPKALRDDIPLIARDNKVLIVLGFEVSRDVAIDTSTKNIVEVILRRRTDE